MTQRVLFTLAVVASVLVSQVAQAGPRPRTLRLVADAGPAAPGFMVRIGVDQDDRCYEEGESLACEVTSEREGYLYLTYYPHEGEAVVLFPNQFQPDNRISAKQSIRVPAAGSSYKIEVAPPHGTGVLHAAVTQQQLTTVGTKNLKTLAVKPITELTQQDCADFKVQLQKQKPEEYAVATVDIETYGQGKEKPKNNRWGVCIGISQFQDTQNIRPLQVSHLDAERMAVALQEQGGVPQQNITLLQNGDATRQKIEQVIAQDLIEKTAPGDTIFIFFSCHGGRCADTNGDETDGYDEYLVPTDGYLEKTETMILDDTFGSWIQQLDGRQVCLLLDNCHSGGAAKGMKGLGQQPKPKKGAIDFLDGEVKRTKDLGQKQTIVVAACQADQVAFERVGQNEGSVLTFYLIEAMKQHKQQSQQLSVGKAFQYADQKVQQYVQKTFQTQQTPVLIDNSQDKILFVP